MCDPAGQLAKRVQPAVAFELLALIVGVLIAALVSADGRSNWLEGAELLAVYIILALAFFLLPV